MPVDVHRRLVTLRFILTTSKYRTYVRPRWQKICKLEPVLMNWERTGGQFYLYFHVRTYVVQEVRISDQWKRFKESVGWISLLIELRNDNNTLSYNHLRHLFLIRNGQRVVRLSTKISIYNINDFTCPCESLLTFPLCYGKVLRSGHSGPWS